MSGGGHFKPVDKLHVPLATAAGVTTLDQRAALKVLVIENDFGDFDAVARALKRIESYAITTARARTIREARYLAATETFDVALVGFNLGLDTGLHFVRENGGRIGGMVTIMLSGSTSAEIQSAALDAGAIACLNKADISSTLLETTIRSGRHTHMLERQLHRVLTELEQSKRVAPAAAPPVTAPDDEAGTLRRLAAYAEDLLRAATAKRGHVAAELEDLKSILSAARRLSGRLAA